MYEVSELAQKISDVLLNAGTDLETGLEALSMVQAKAIDSGYNSEVHGDVAEALNHLLKGLLDCYEEDKAIPVPTTLH